MDKYGAQKCFTDSLTFGGSLQCVEHNEGPKKFCDKEAPFIVSLNISLINSATQYFFFLKSINVPLDLLWDALIWIW